MMNTVSAENPLMWDILQLASNLRQERLFVNSEQILLQELNEKVMDASSKLAEVAWITSQQRLNLNKLIVSRPDTTPAMCSKKANSLNSAKFVSAQNVLGYQKCTSYGEVLDSLRGSPELIARCLVVGDSCLSEEMPSIVHSLVTGLYASCVLPEDKNIVLKILGHLISLQLTQSDTPRRLLRPGSCAFSCLYSVFHESLFSAKLYLTAALHSPIMQLLMMEEKYLDIDPEKVAIRLEERAKLMGVDAGSNEHYNLDIETHRASTVQVLASVAKTFIASLQDNLHCFPRSVCWLVNRIYLQLTKTNSLPEKEVFSMCTDLVLTLFICPAIVKPEPYGITDVPISSVARFNLIQVAQIIQMLALRKFEPIDPKLDDLYSHFDKNSVSSIIETMIDPNFIIDDPVVDAESGKFEHLTRTTALFTENELNALIVFLRTVSNTNSGDVKLQKELPSLLNQLPSPAANGHPKPNFTSPEISTKKSKILKGNKFKHHNGSNTGPGILIDEDEYGPTVLVIPFDINNDSSLGLDSEQKILAMEKDVDGDRAGKGLKTEKSDRVEGQEKRTRFSLSHDDGSIGNTSDNLEVVSEAPSNHSVASSLELETEDQNDNLSDMISANVSGRGSPSISGRDTPSSQITEGDESAAGGSSVRQQLDFTPTRPAKIAPQPRFDLDEKFGKFEIKTLMDGADETFSLVSDTWSTDVLASDSEILEQQLPPTLPPPLLPEPIPATITPSQLDTTETASEAWSTDVMASDSERMTEVDTDDTASVARSDDTGRSEIESRGDPEPTEDVAGPHASGGGNLVTGVGSIAIQPVTSGPPAPSPVRHSESINPVSTSNVTGRGGARSDYRRRTLEYLDSNRNIYSKLGHHDDIAIGAYKEVVRLAAAPSVSAVAPASASNVVPSISSPATLLPTVAGQELEDDRTERDSMCAPLSCVSASSSSSGSSDVATNQTNEIPAASLIVPNGSVAVEDIVGSAKPSSAPGAIPKSISFDKTAERGDKESLDEDGKPKKSFFRFKLPFKSRRGKSFRLDGFEGATNSPGDSSFPLVPARFRRGISAEEASNRPTSSSSLVTASSFAARLDTSDDILAKYRGQSSSSSIGKPTTSVVSSGPPSESAGSSEKPPSDKCYDLFEDARKKLRLALSTSEVQQLPDALHLRETWNRKENDLITFLRLQLAEAINLQDSCLTPQLYETLRCVKMLSEEECRKLFDSLKEDYKNRKPYISYLIKCRQGLLSTLAHIDRLKERVRRDRTVVLEFLSSMCVRMFLERREQQLAKFAAEFQALTLADEKSDLSDTFLERFFMEMTKDPVWQSASEDQLEQARISVERSLFNRVYLPAMYPNGDGDIARDQVLSEHITKLAKVISPDHKDLRIPQMFLCECPWLSAQAEMSQMAAYRSPRDKLHCVLRSILTIMNLLSLTCVPAADDLMPVLVYVIIMANPPSLLSTLEYVTSFYGNRLEGEEQYYWTQFSSAIEFIKTMDYLVNE